jgi:hypothetical protein
LKVTNDLSKRCAAGRKQTQASFLQFKQTKEFMEVAHHSFFEPEENFMAVSCRKVLFAIDLSARSRNAFPHAADMATHHSTGMVSIHVPEVPDHADSHGRWQ